MYELKNPCYIIRNEYFLETIDDINKKGYIIIEGDSFSKSSCFVKTERTDKSLDEIREIQNGIITELFNTIRGKDSVEPRFGFDKMLNCS